MKKGSNKYFTSISFIMKGLLGYMAYCAPYPVWLSPLLHKIRGVRIANVFDVYIAPNVVIDSLFPELVTIEEDVYLTRGVKVITHFNPTESIKKNH